MSAERMVSAEEARALHQKYGSFARREPHEQRVLDLAYTVEQQGAQIAAVKALLGNPEDPYVHVHDGDLDRDFMPDCAGCWSRDIRLALGVTS